MQDVLANLLKRDAVLLDLVGSRIDWDEAPQGQKLPSIVMFVISGVVDYAMAGATGYVVTRVQFDCRGKSAKEARAVAEGLEACFSGCRGVFQGVDFQGCFEQNQRTGSGKDGPTKWFYDSRDYRIHWAKA